MRLLAGLSPDLTKTKRIGLGILTLCCANRKVSYFSILFFLLLLLDFLPVAPSHHNNVPNINLTAEIIHNINNEIPMDYTPIESEFENHTYFERASQRTIEKHTPLFVGIAISGGGSRAANFGAAVMFELNRLGLLEHTQAISAVSGGALPAAYYSLFSNEITFEWAEFRRRMAVDFRSKWVSDLLNPVTIINMLWSDYDRSDAMANIFDSELFKHKRFRDLNEEGPILLINATRNGSFAPFIFSSDSFSEINSGIGEYPISHAVMASGAFPGVFDNVTLRDFRCDRNLSILNVEQLRYRILHENSLISNHIRQLLGPQELSAEGLEAELINLACGNDRDWIFSVLPDWSLYTPRAFRGLSLHEDTRQLLDRKNFFSLGLLNRRILEDAFPEHILRQPSRFVHLFDGGVADNLGLEALERVVSIDGSTYDRCLLIVVDAFTGDSPADSTTPDTRRYYDLLINTNALDAVNGLLSSRRSIQLAARKIHDARRSEQYPLAIRRVGEQECLLWHVTFSRMDALHSMISSMVFESLTTDLENALDMIEKESKSVTQF